MLINPNLLSTNIVKISPEDQTHRFAYLFVPEGLEEGKEYTFSCFCKYDGSDSGTILLADDNDAAAKIYWYETKNGLKNEFTFVYNKERHKKFLIYAGVPRYTNNVSAYIYNIKLEEGTEATPFIPHKNTIKTAKRQYFIGGDTSRKYIQYKFTDKELRTYKKGW